jgi:hypothetical protein
MCNGMNTSRGYNIVLALRLAQHAARTHAGNAGVAIPGVSGFSPQAGIGIYRRLVQNRKSVYQQLWPAQARKSRPDSHRYTTSTCRGNWTLLSCRVPNSCPQVTQCSCCLALLLLLLLLSTSQCCSCSRLSSCCPTPQPLACSSLRLPHVLCWLCMCRPLLVQVDVRSGI